MATDMEASMFSMFNMHVCVCMHVCIRPLHIPIPTPIHPSATPSGVTPGIS